MYFLQHITRRPHDAQRKLSVRKTTVSAGYYNKYGCFGTIDPYAPVLEALIRTQTSVCHCRPCRKITGGVASLNLTVATKVFELQSGNLKTIRTTHIDEGFEFTLAFCADCGSPIYAMPHGDPQFDIVVMQVGTIDSPALLEMPPKVELNAKCRLGWVKKLEGAEQRQAYVN